MKPELETGELNPLVAELGLSQRAAGAVLRDFARRRGLDYATAVTTMRLSELTAYTLADLQALRHFGERSLMEVLVCLSARNLALAPTTVRPRRRPEFIPASPFGRPLRRQVI